MARPEQAWVRQQEKRSNYVGQRRAERRHAQEELRWKAFAQGAGTRWRIEDAAKVFDEMPMRAVLKNARVLLLGEASRMQDAVGRMLRRCTGRRCAGAAR
jgi:hypothetical protein